MDNNPEITVKVTAYEKGTLPTKLGQLKNDANFITREEMVEYLRQQGGVGVNPIRVVLDGGNANSLKEV